MILTNKELYEIKGGGFRWGTVYAISLVFSFLYGVIDGLIKLK
jgi:hypothetical protein